MRRFALILTLTFAPVFCSAAVPAANHGESLYATHCAACHGNRGGGGVGIPLNLQDFLAGAPDAYLATTIRLGRPGRVMPGFPDLDAADLHAIIAHLRSWSSQPAPVMSKRAVSGSAVRGKALYARHCADCHGAGGEGGKGTGVTFSRPRDLPVIAPALNNPGFHAAASDAMLLATLERGRQGTPMTSFLEQGLTRQDLQDIVVFVRTLNRPAGGFAEHQSPLLVYDSPYGLAETIASVKQAAQGKNFRLIRDQFLEQGLQPAGQEQRNQVMVYFCNFEFLYQALAIDPRVGLFLPCRVTVVERQGRVQVMAINPKRLSRLFNNAELDQACDRMYQLYVEILEEATL